MNIRIGNDICLYVNLLGNKNLDAVNINSIEAFLINTSKWLDLMDEQYRETALMQDEINFRKDKIKYVSRFPVEPHFPGFHPTSYDICCSGRPGYNCLPVPYVPMYHGFGVYPHTFEPGRPRPHVWHPDHRHHHPIEPHTWGFDDMHDIYERAGYKYMDMQRQYDRCRFLAPVEATDSKNKIKVYFPAQAQIYTGTYKLIIVAKVYEPGYCKNSLRTITIDYENVFTLVNRSDQGCDGDITIRVGTNKFYAEEIKLIRPGSDDYTMLVNSELSIGQTDYVGKIYKLIIDLRDGSSVDYNPEDWEFGSIVFESMSPGIIKANETFGRLTAMSGSENKSAVIKVYNNQHDELTSFVVNAIEQGEDNPPSEETEKYTLTYKDGDVILSTQEYEYGKAITPIANPTKSGYTFNGWTPAVPSTMPKLNVTVVANWTENEVPSVYYTLRYKDGDTTIGTLQYEVGATISPVSNPSKVGYTFDRWLGMPSDMKMPANNLTVTASWTENEEPDPTTVNVTGITVSPKTIFINKGDQYTGLTATVIPSNATNNTYYWSSEDGNIATVDTNTGTVTIQSSAQVGDTVKIYAISEENNSIKDYATITVTEQTPSEPEEPSTQWRVTFYPNNGQSQFHQDVNNGEKLVAVTAPTKEGYTFNGWHVTTETGNVWDFNSSVTSNMTLVAGWTQTTPPTSDPLTVKVKGDGNAEIQIDGGWYTLTDMNVDHHGTDSLDKIYSGDDVYVYIRPKDGYRITGVTDIQYDGEAATNVEWYNEDRIVVTGIKSNTTVTVVTQETQIGS